VIIIRSSLGGFEFHSADKVLTLDLTVSPPASRLDRLEGGYPSQMMSFRMQVTVE